MRHPCHQCSKPDLNFTDLFSEYLCDDCPVGAYLADEAFERLLAAFEADEQEKGAP